jgi:hypothetical protein
MTFEAGQFRQPGPSRGFTRYIATRPSRADASFSLWRRSPRTASESTSRGSTSSSIAKRRSLRATMSFSNVLHSRAGRVRPTSAILFKDNKLKDECYDNNDNYSAQRTLHEVFPESSVAITHFISSISLGRSNTSSDGGTAARARAPRSVGGARSFPRSFRSSGPLHSPPCGNCCDTNSCREAPLSL